MLDYMQALRERFVGECNRERCQEFHALRKEISQKLSKEDRRKLYILKMQPLKRKADGKQFGYSVFTKSIGSGKESRFTLFNRDYKRCPVQEGDIILCKQFARDGEYFKLLSYEQVY